MGAGSRLCHGPVVSPETRFPHLHKGRAQSLPGSPQGSQCDFSERAGMEELCKLKSAAHPWRLTAAPGLGPAGPWGVETVKSWQ